MEHPSVTPVHVAAVEPEAELQLWAAPPMVVVTQFVGGVVFVILALTNLLGDTNGWHRFLGVLAAIVGGVAFGVGGSLSAHARMVRRHVEVWHGEGAVVQPRTAPGTDLPHDLSP
jgi:hypothetical protein